MSRCVSKRVRLAPSVRRALEATVRRGKSEHRDVLRAQIVLMAAKGIGNNEIARRLGCERKTVRKWRDRFVARPKLSTLRDDERSGRPATIPVSARCELLAIACTRPADQKTRFREVWTGAALADAFRRRTGFVMSVTEVRRTLRAAALRPHRVRMWLHSPDPDFRAKVRRICRLYRDPPRDSVVLCIDEKTGMQAIEREHPMHIARVGTDGRFEFEYVRHGTRTLIAAFNPHTGHVIAHCRRRRTAADLLSFMEAIAKAYPRGKVHVVWDNLNIHNGKRWVTFNRRHRNRFRFHYTPLHASWVNQIEIWFSILHRRVLKYGSFGSPIELTRAVSSFVTHWNHREAHPFRWTFTGEFKLPTAA